MFLMLSTFFHSLAKFGANVSNLGHRIITSHMMA